MRYHLIGLALLIPNKLVIAAPACVEPPGAETSIEAQKKADAAAPASPGVPTPPAHQTARKLRAIARPIEASGKGQFNLSYAVFPGKDSNGEKSRVNQRPTIIMIGGGPGAPNIQTGRSENIPPGYDVIRLDQRGTGLNRQVDVRDFGKTFSSQQDADDVKAIIKAEGLTNYVVWGQSYGTVVATKLGEDLGRHADVPRPKSIVLEGVFGRALRVAPDGTHEGDQAISAQSAKLWRRLGDTEREGLKALHATFTSRHDGSDQRFENFLIQMTGLRAEMTLNILAATAKQSPDEILKSLDSMEKMMPPPPKADEKQMKFGASQYRAVACNELFESGKPAKPFPMYGGLFTQPSLMNSACGPCFKRSRGFYDSKSHQIQNIPVHYLEGENDIRTPPWQGEYHRDNQRAKARNTYSMIEGGTHIPSEQTLGPLSTAACNQRLLAAAFGTSNVDFTAGVEECQRNAPKLPAMPASPNSSGAAR